MLTAIVVPVLVRAEREDADHGEAFVRRLFTASLVLLGMAALLATLAAPVLTKYVFLSEDGKGQHRPDHGAVVSASAGNPVLRAGRRCSQRF